MKSYYSFFIFLILSTLLFSCKNNMSNDPGVGFGIQPEGDHITVKSDEFNVKSENLFVDEIYNRPDSLLLGYYDGRKYGKLKADILTEFDAPFGESVTIENRFPEGSKVDSAVILLQYSSFFGEKSLPMQVNAYEFNKNAGLDYNKYYPSNIDPAEFVETSANNALIGSTVFTAQKEGSKNRSGDVRIVLNKEFRDKIFGLTADYKTRSEFLEKLRGVYITSDLADATMLNISGMNMLLYYKYERNIEGKDTLISNYILFPANELISKINRFEHPDRETVKETLSENKEFNYLSTPGNIYTEVKLPIRKMVEEMQAKVGDKKLIINSAKLDVDFVKEENETQIPLPLFKNLLLVKKENKNDFVPTFNPNSLYFGTFNPQSDPSLRYSIDITNLLTEQVQKLRAGETLDETQDMILIPTNFLVSIDSRTSKEVLTGIAQKTQITGLTICSGEHKEKPMKIDVVFSSF